MRIWASLSLQGYFELEAWGPDFRRAWEVLTTLNDRFRCRVTDLEGRMREVHITRELVRGAWNLTEGQLTYNDRTHTEEDRRRCTAVDHPTWDDLHHQQIRLPLQLHTQHLQVTNPHRWSMGEKGVAIEYTNRQVLNTPLNMDYIGTWLGKLLKAAKSSITQAKSKAKRPPMPYLGAVLALTRIVYCALDALDGLPPPWDVPENAVIESRTISQQKVSDKERLRKKREDKKRKREKSEAAEKPTSPRKTRSKKPDAEESSDHDGSDDGEGDHSDPDDRLPMHDQDLEEALRASKLISHTSQQFEPKGTSFMTQTESELIREITVSMSQDTEFVLKLARAAEEMEAERKQSQNSREEQEQRERNKAKEAERKKMEEATKDKGKGKLQEGEGTSQMPPRVDESRQAIMTQLRSALAQEEATALPSATPLPLQGILDSFVVFYKQAQQIEELRIKQEAELLQMKALQDEEGKKVHELEIQLTDALRVNAETQQELQAALMENLNKSCEDKEKI